jgi:hypothetical protein
MPGGMCAADLSTPPAGGSVLYRYRTIQAHLETFLARIAGDDGGGLPRFVTRKLRAYLRCGLLEHGCLHVRCDRCQGGSANEHSRRQALAPSRSNPGAPSTRSPQPERRVSDGDF